MQNEFARHLVIMTTVAWVLPHAAMHHGLGMLAPPVVSFMLLNQSLHAAQYGEHQRQQQLTFQACWIHWVSCVRPIAPELVS